MRLASLGRPFVSLALALALAFAGSLACRSQPKEPDAAALIADLSSDDAEKSGKASVTILGKGDLAVPGLIEMLGSPDPKLRSRAATTLWGLGGSAKAAVPALAVALKDTDVTVRRPSASALGNMGPLAADAVPALIGALNDSDNQVRQLSAKALGAIGPAAKAALPALDALARREGLREAAEDARKKISGGR